MHTQDREILQIWISGNEGDVTRVEDVLAAVESCTDGNLLINNAGGMLASPMVAEASGAASRVEMEANVFGGCDKRDPEGRRLCLCGHPFGQGDDSFTRRI
jgi:NAD(P)-dependent dehydrogenase (short-subunit alcohol dehydrogenase family)